MFCCVTEYIRNVLCQTCCSNTSRRLVIYFSYLTPHLYPAVPPLRSFSDRCTSPVTIESRSFPSIGTGCYGQPDNRSQALRSVLCDHRYKPVAALKTWWTKISRLGAVY
jgi:hypothetical protein